MTTPFTPMQMGIYNRMVLTAAQGGRWMVNFWYQRGETLIELENMHTGSTAWMEKDALAEKLLADKLKPEGHGWAPYGKYAKWLKELEGEETEEKEE